MVILENEPFYIHFKKPGHLLFFVICILKSYKIMSCEIHDILEVRDNLASTSPTSSIAYVACLDLLALYF